MALFKILKGRHNKLNAQSKTDGWAWFTPDNGSFYIDALNTDETEINRIQINPKSIVIETEIYGSGSSLWDLDNKIFPIINENITENYNGYITVNSRDFNLMRQATLANFHIVNHRSGSLFVQAKGVIPTNTIPVTITLIPAPTPIYYAVSTYNKGTLVATERIQENTAWGFEYFFTGDITRVTITMGDEELISKDVSEDPSLEFSIPYVTDDIVVNMI